MSNQDVPPKVFISYSHDSPEHKDWVLRFARELRENGVDPIIDVWGLRPGNDVLKFMERGVRDSNRVLMICTEKYVAKADSGVGGVGYEAMIVTAELVRDLGTAKFIPIIRQNSVRPIVPTSVSTRLYINLSHGADHVAEMKSLLQELHSVPPERPPLGPSPFTKTRSAVTTHATPPGTSFEATAGGHELAQADSASDARPHLRSSRASASLLVATLSAIVSGWWWIARHSDSQSSSDPPVQAAGPPVQDQEHLTSGEAARVDKALWEFKSYSAGDGETKIVSGDAENENISITFQSYSGSGETLCRFGFISIERGAVQRAGQVSSCSGGHLNYADLNDQGGLTAREVSRVGKALWGFKSYSAGDGVTATVSGDGDNRNMSVTFQSYSGSGEHLCRFGLISVESGVTPKAGRVSSCTNGNFKYIPN